MTKITKNEFLQQVKDNYIDAGLTLGEYESDMKCKKVVECEDECDFAGCDGWRWGTLARSSKLIELGGSLESIYANSYQRLKETQAHKVTARVQP